MVVGGFRSCLCRLRGDLGDARMGGVYIVIVVAGCLNIDWMVDGTSGVDEDNRHRLTFLED